MEKVKLRNLARILALVFAIRIVLIFAFGIAYFAFGWGPSIFGFSGIIRYFKSFTWTAYAPTSNDVVSWWLVLAAIVIIYIMGLAACINFFFVTNKGADPRTALKRTTITLGILTLSLLVTVGGRFLSQSFWQIQLDLYIHVIVITAIALFYFNLKKFLASSALPTNVVRY